MEKVENMSRRYLREAAQQNEGGGMEGYRSRILQKNRVEGLLRMDQRYLDGICYHYYDITAMDSMEEIFAGRKIEGACLEELFGELDSTLGDMEIYLLNQSELCLRPEYIMRNSETGKWVFLYIPGYAGEQASDLEKLAEYMIEHIDYSDEDLQERVYELYDNVAQTGGKAAPAGVVQFWKRNKKDMPEVAAPRQNERYVRMEPPAVQISETEGETEPREEEKKKIWRRKIYRTPYRGSEIQNVSQPTLTETLGM